MSIQFGGSIPFPMFLTGGNVPAVGVSPVVQIAKEGGSFAAPFGAINNIGNGFFRIAANIHDTDTPGTLCLSATAPGCDPTTLIYVIDPKENPRDMRKTEKLLGDTNDILQDLLDRNY